MHAAAAADDADDKLRLRICGVDIPGPESEWGAEGRPTTGHEKSLRKTACLFCILRLKSQDHAGERTKLTLPGREIEIEPASGRP
jgi:hypothetical protein